ncbi:MAG: hypothetical protein LBU19_03895, partial [Treponema sp.]|nr:hypothetical protein [Treponema sp.]
MKKRKQTPLSVFSFAVKHAVLILYAAACLYPFLWMAGTSLKNRQEALANPATMFPSGQMHFETYAEVWGKLNFFQY